MEEEAKTSLAPSPKPRKRRGRPPKAKAPTQAQANVSAADLETEKPERAPTSSPTACECWRSSRKKVAKFDVRDLLKKNRKTSKTEAGLESKASTAQEAGELLGVADSVPTTSNQSQSKSIAKPQAIQIEKSKPASKPQLPRKQGRPRKLRVMLKDVRKSGIEKAKTSLLDFVTNSTNFTLISVGSERSDVSSIPKIKKKSKLLRVNIKRMNMPTSGESSDAKSIPLSVESNLFSSASLNSTVELSKKPNQEQAETETKADLKTEPLKLLPAVDDDSDLQIVFKEIDSKQTETDGNKPKEAKGSKKEEQTLKTLAESKLALNDISDGDVKVGEDKAATQKCKKHLAEEESTAMMALETQTPLPDDSDKRRGERSSLRSSSITSSSSKLTLEQTFAQIETKSTKSIIMSEAPQVDEVEDVNLPIDLIEDSIIYSNKYKIQLESKLQLVSTEVQLSNLPAVQLDAFFKKDKPTETATTSDEKEEEQLEEKEIATQMPKSGALQLKKEKQKKQMEEKHELPDEQQLKEAKKPTHVPIDEPDAQPDVKVTLEPASIAESPPEEKQHSSRCVSSNSTFVSTNITDKNKSKKTLKEKTVKLDKKWEQCKKQDNYMDKEEDSQSSSLQISQEFNQGASVKGPSPNAGKLKKEQQKRHPSRQNSTDSSSSGSLKRKSGRVNDSLKLALSETESSESTCSSSKPPSGGLPTPTSDLDAQHPLKNIVKLIDREQREQTSSKQEQPADDEFALRVANMETPATTPSTSPQLNGSTEENAMSTGVRRSHRIKKKPQMLKTNLELGCDNKTNNLQSSTSISMETRLAELAQIEAINEQFLRREGLNTFQTLKDNFYRCARQVSQENAEMQCDCFLTGDEEAKSHLCCGARCINRMLMIECGPLCTNGARCTNKRFQQHQCWPCRVFRTDKKGCGITAELQIPSGEFIMEYVGEVIDSEEFERRQDLYSLDRNRHYYFMALRGEAIIDATAKGNISRYINHSCDPNAETQKWTVNGELRIGFFSLKTIKPGEEITFDYQYQRYGSDAQRCYCEASNCRGWIGGEPDSDEGEHLADKSDTEPEIKEQEEKGQQVEQETLRAKQPQKNKSIKAIKSKSKQKQQTSSHKQQRKEQPKSKDRENKAGRWLHPSSDKSVDRAPHKLEDPDVLDQLKLLNRSGLKNQADTLRFSRCMVRAKLLQSRLQLLDVLTRGELPCRRLFLDYHGLRLLHAWVSESGIDTQLRLAMIGALESLPIPNKTMLNDSRVYQSVQLWSTAGSQLKQQHKPVGKPEAVHQRMLNLLHKWDSLPETFRIPKRERIEQMKEHEREADCQLDHQTHQHAVTALEDSNSNSAFSTLTSDPYRQDRFRRDTINRYEKPKPVARMSGNNTICSTSNGGSMATIGNGNGIGKSDPRRRSDLTNPSGGTISKELRRSLFEQKVAKSEAEKRIPSEDWQEHVARCEYFGAPLNTDPNLLPFYENTETNEWFNKFDVRVPAPRRCGKENDSPEVDEEVEVEYQLPPSVEPLPPAWHWAISDDGSIYYFNLRTRHTQWEPPNAQQRLEKLVDTPSDLEPSSEEDPENPEVHIDTALVVTLSPRSREKYVDEKVRERRELRRNRLVSVRLISPRRDEDRLASQLASCRYKENKEKIRRRKEIYHREQREQKNNYVGSQSLPGGTLPIPRYLYSSDEDDEEGAVGGCANSTLLDNAIVDGVKVKHVDEPEAKSYGYNRYSSFNENAKALNMQPSTSKSALAAFSKQQQFKPISPLLSLPMPPLPMTNSSSMDVLLSMKRKLPLPPHTLGSQKRKRDDREKNRRPPLSSTVCDREACDKFRADISGPVAKFLRPYRKDSCKLGRISNEEDYQYLVRRLSHHITTKEMRYCDVTGHPLACTESVKKKTYEFIKQYMENKGRVYEKPEDEPDYY